MIVMVNPSGDVALEDQDNFKAFKVISAIPVNQAEDSLKAVGRLDGGHLWVSRAWLESNGSQDEAWRSGLRKMIDYAASAGWVDDAGAVRAHIEIVDR